MKTFLGIGASHLDDVFDFVYGILSNYKPKAITLENQMSFTNVGESTRYALGREREFYAGESRIRYDEVVGDVELIGFMRGGLTTNRSVRKVRLFLDDLCVLTGNNLEFNPVLAYVLETDTPFYFTDVPLLGKDIVEFRKDGYRVISLEDYAKLTKDIPSDSIPFRRDDITRNKFAADAINYLFTQGYGCVAHVGGTRHFNVNYAATERWEPYPQGENYHIQDFVEADRVVVADSNTFKIYEFKKNPKGILVPK